MKLAIVGAGIIGITTAFELASDGHEVTVLERRGTAAEESSFANAGVVAPGYVTPWAAPGMPWKVFKHLFGQHAPVKLGQYMGWGLGWQDLSWMARWWLACTPATYTTNRSQMQQLALYSKERLQQIRTGLSLEYDRSDGYMVLLRSLGDSRLIQPSLKVLRDAGVGFAELDAAGARKIEPALNPDTVFHGAVHLPQDEAGNCRQFALLLKGECQRLGVTFVFNQTVAKLVPGIGQGVDVHLGNSPTPQRFDAVVVCAGLDSATLLRPLGVRLPLAPVYGYSISANIKEPLNAPRSAVMDERFKVAISRLGNRVRVAGSAELGGHPSRLRQASIKTLYKVLQDWFPGAAVHSSGVQIWKGARPMLPDGPPALGASGTPGIWLNLGHGSSGWALSCGSARAIADLIGQRKPALDLVAFSAARFK